MTDNNNKKGSTGPQGTQVFEVDEVNKMIAEEIASSQSADADTPALIGISKEVAGHQFILSKTKVEIGRRPNSDIVLNDSSVSSMHAQMINHSGQWKVLNLLSSNGTYVNGEKVAEQAIKPGDRVSFAGSEFVFAMIDKPVEQQKSSSKWSLLLVVALLLAGLGGVLYFLL